RPTDFKTEDHPERRMLVFKREDDKADPNEGLNGFVGIQVKANAERNEVIIVDTIEGSPAATSGLKKDDVGLKTGDGPATDLRPTVELCRQLKPGTEVTVRIRRGDREQEVKLKVGVMPFFYLD